MDQIFGSISQALQGKTIDDLVVAEKTKRILPHFKLDDGFIYYERKKCVPRKKVNEILKLAHDNRLGAHFFFSKTLSRLAHLYWKSKAHDVENYCFGCHTCQQAKDSRTKPFGVPTPLEIPSRHWGSIGTDFIVGLPKTKDGNDAITTYIDRFTKRVHFLATTSAAYAKQVASDFFNNIFKIHSLPDSVVSDRDPRFTSKFWTELMRLCEIQTKMATSHDPQTDGISEITNRMIGNYLRCFCDHNQGDWDTLLTSAEFAHNSANVSNMDISPFELDLGWKPKSPIELVCSQFHSSVESVNELQQRLLESFQDALFAHRLSQARQSAYNAKRYRPPSYKVGDEVWLSRKYFTDSASKVQVSRKLGVKRYGSFKIIEMIGKNAVRLDLPPNIRVHPVVHVERTARVTHQQKDLSNNQTIRPPVVTERDGSLLMKADRVLHDRKRGRGFQLLTAYKGASPPRSRMATHKRFLRQRWNNHTGFPRLHHLA